MFLTITLIFKWSCYQTEQEAVVNINSRNLDFIYIYPLLATISKFEACFISVYFNTLYYQFPSLTVEVSLNSKTYFISCVYSMSRQPSGCRSWYQEIRNGMSFMCPLVQTTSCLIRLPSLRNDQIKAINSFIRGMVEWLLL